MTINFKYILFLLLSAILFQCVPPEEVVLTEVTRDLRDSTLQEIIRYQDEPVSYTHLTLPTIYSV